MSTSFISWVEIKDRSGTMIFFLTDEEIFSEEGDVALSKFNNESLLGHDAIRAFFSLDGRGSNGHSSDFWDTNTLPGEIGKLINNFKQHWGKCLENGCFSKNYIKYVISNAPKKWKDLFRDYLIKKPTQELWDTT